jgi:hypothetical protein
MMPGFLKSPRHDRIGFNLDLCFAINQPGDLHNGRGRPDLRENFTVYFSDLLPF